jgi:hypothetical protein
LGGVWRPFFNCRLCPVYAQLDIPIVRNDDGDCWHIICHCSYPYRGPGHWHAYGVAYAYRAAHLYFDAVAYLLGDANVVAYG